MFRRNWLQKYGREREEIVFLSCSVHSSSFCFLMTKLFCICNWKLLIGNSCETNINGAWFWKIHSWSLPNLCVQLVWLPLEMAIWEQTVGDLHLFLICFLSLLLKVPTPMMSKYYPWKFNLVICLLISFHLLPLHFQVFVKRLRMIIPFCFLLKSTWHNIEEVLSSKLLILQFRESDLTGNSIDSYMAIVIFK